MVATVGSIAIRLLADSGQLAGALRAAGVDVTQFESKAARSLKRVDGTFTGAFASMSRSAGNLAMSLGKGALAGALAGLGAGAIISSVQNTARALAELGDEAKRAGVSVQAFQEWRYVAETARIPIDSMVDALKELNIRADEFAATGSGAAAEAFARLGLTRQEVQERLKDPSALMLELIERTRRLGDTAAGVRVFDELFGGSGGERLVALLSQSTEEIQGTIDRAHTLGRVLDTQLIARATELDRAFADVAGTVGNELQGAIANASWQLYHFLQQFGEVEGRTGESLNQSMRDLGKERVDLENRILTLQRQQREAIEATDLVTETNIRDAIGVIQGRLEELLAAEADILAELDARRPPRPIAETTDPIGAGAGDYDTLAKTFELPKPKTARTSGGGRSSAISETQRQADTTANLIAKLREELDLIGASETERRVMNELRAAGVTLASEEGQTIAGLVTQIEAESTAMAELESQMESVKGLAKDFLGGIISDLRSGVSGAEALGNAFGRLSDRLVDMALDTPIPGPFHILRGIAA